MNYQGHAFNDRFKGGKSSGEIQFSSGQISFLVNGQLEMSFAYKGLTLERGGSGERLIYFKHDAHPDWVFYSSDESILNDHSLQLNCPQYVSLMKKKKNIARAILLGSLAAFVLFLVGLWMLKKPLVEKATEAIPVSWEVEMGQKVFDTYSSQLLLVDDVELNDEMQVLLDELLSNIKEKPYPYQFHLVVDETPNAAAFPGGNVIIHTGLFNLAETPEEILGVVAHEIAHVNERHSLRSMINAAGTLVLMQFLFGDIEALSTVFIEGGTSLLFLKNSRDHEREADVEGWAYLVEAGISPKGFITFFEKLENWKPKELIEGSEEALSLLSTHPMTKERVEYLNKKLAEEDQGQFREINFDLIGFKERMTEVIGKGFKKDKSTNTGDIKNEN